MNGMIIQGYRGLFTVIDGKIAFPDRSFTDACVGLVKDIEITKDKGTYCFFKGTMVRNVVCDDWIYAQNFLPLDCSCLSRFCLNGTDALVRYYGYQVVVFVGDEEFYVTRDPRIMGAIRGICGLNVYSFAGKIIKDVMEISDKATEFDVMCAAYMLLGRNILDKDTKYAIDLWDEKVLGIRYDGVYTCISPISSVRKFEKGEFRVKTDIASCLEVLGKPTETVECSEIVEYMRKNYISAEESCGCDVVSEYIRFGGSSYIIKMFSFYAKDPNVVKEAVTTKNDLYYEVKDSVEGFELWAKRVGKYLSAKTAGEFGTAVRAGKRFINVEK